MTINENQLNIKTRNPLLIIQAPPPPPPQSMFDEGVNRERVGSLIGPNRGGGLNIKKKRLTID